MTEDRLSLTRTHGIWRLNNQEIRYVMGLPPEEREDARLYFTGYKLLLHRRNQPLPDFLTRRTTREKRGPRWADYFVSYISKEINPFHEFLRGQDLDKYDINEEKNQMGLFLLGYRMVYLQPDISEQAVARVLADNNEPNELMRSMVSFAKEILNELSPQDFMPLDKPRPSRRGSHTRDEKGNRSPPTMGDLVHVKDQLHELGLGSNWVFEETIYQHGNMGSDRRRPKRRIVHIFSTVDEDGVLRKRIVVKVEGFYNADNVETAHEEYRIHEDLTEAGSYFILDCHGHSVRIRKPLRRDNSPTHLLYGYLEHAPYNNLCDLAYAARREGFFIPEFYLWHIFRSLAIALFHLEIGPADPRLSRSDLNRTNDEFRTRRKVDGWKSIVNLDIKSTNVVLGDPHPDYPAFPVPKMMDFGLCYRHPVSTVRRYKPSGEDAEGGTDGWMSPEQLQRNGITHRRRYNDDIGDTISVHSHIFGVGLIMLSLMNRSDVPHLDNRAAPTHLNDYDSMYSARLDFLVTECVSLLPAERPALPQLLDRTLEGMKLVRQKAWRDPFRREKHELEPMMRPRGVQGREPQIGAFMGDGWRYAKRRRVMEEGRDES